jgi:enoyl-CoA hydratase
VEARLVAAAPERMEATLTEALRDLGRDAGAARLAEHRRAIDGCYARQSVAAILDALAAAGEWGNEQRTIIAGKSPFASKVTFAQLRCGRDLDFAGCMRLEYRMVHRLLESGEFAEGVRALLIDKDKAPRWRYPDLTSVPGDAVEAVFAPLPQGDLPFDWDGV